MSQRHDANPPIRHVSDTVLGTALFRTPETERADALFRDPYANYLAGIRGEQIDLWFY
jgi:O-methyltransferase involved in polyketide biosynthesis